MPAAAIETASEAIAVKEVQVQETLIELYDAEVSQEVELTVIVGLFYRRVAVKRNNWVLFTIYPLFLKHLLFELIYEGLRSIVEKNQCGRVCAIPLNERDLVAIFRESEAK